MLSFLDGLRDLSLVSVLLRLVLALLCGGAIGLERSYRGRNAGLRTHVLICIGGAMASMTGLYLYIGAGLPADVSRIGAQVVSGLGFIGAGTIMVTQRRTIHGLTTAAGLWLSGVIGLAIGAGYYEGGVLAMLLVLIVVLCYPMLHQSVSNPERPALQLRYSERSVLRTAMRVCNEAGTQLARFELQTDGEGEALRYTARFDMSPLRPDETEALLKLLRAIPGMEEVRQLDALER